MAQLAAMKDVNFPKPMQVMTDERLKHRFKRLVLSFELNGPKFCGETLTMAATNAAIWLWFTSLPRERAMAFLETELPKLEAFLREGGVSEVDAPPENPSDPDVASPLKAAHVEKPEKKVGRGKKDIG